MLYFFKDRSNPTLFFERRDTLENIIREVITAREDLLKQGINLAGIEIGVVESIDYYKLKISDD